MSDVRRRATTSADEAAVSEGPPGRGAAADHHHLARHTSTNTRSFGARFYGPENGSFFPPAPPLTFTHLLNNPTFRVRKRRLWRMTSGRHKCLARHQSES